MGAKTHTPTAEIRKEEVTNIITLKTEKAALPMEDSEYISRRTNYNTHIFSSEKAKEATIIIDFQTENAAHGIGLAMTTGKQAGRRAT